MMSSSAAVLSASWAEDETEKAHFSSLEIQLNAVVLEAIHSESASRLLEIICPDIATGPERNRSAILSIGDTPVQIRL